MKWAKAWEGDYACGHEAVRAYWQRQWQEIKPQVTPEKIEVRDDGRTAVCVDLLLKDLEEKIIVDEQVNHLYTFQDGLIIQMDIEPLQLPYLALTKAIRYACSAKYLIGLA